MYPECLRRSSRFLAVFKRPALLRKRKEWYKKRWEIGQRKKGKWNKGEKKDKYYPRRSPIQSYKVVQKTDTQFYFWDNFGNSAPILTILSLLQAEIYGA